MRNRSSTDDVAAIDIEAEPFGAEALGDRTAAGGHEQIVGASISRIVPSGSCASISTPLAPAAAFVTLVPV